MKGARLNTEDTPADVARVALLKWRQANSGAPVDWRAVARRIATHSDMPPAWEELARRGVAPLAMLSFATNALDSAAKETRRQTASEERAGIERVVRLARELRDAIEESPLPRGWAKYVTFAESENAAPLLVGWRDIDSLAEDHEGFCPAFSICDVLELAEELAQAHLNGLPPRSMARHRGKGARPLQVAFVRWLAWGFGVRLGRELRGVVARVATAVFDGSPLTKRDVDVILKDRPPSFVPPKRRVQKS